MLSNPPVVFRPLNYVLKLSPVVQSVTARTFMVATPVIHRYAADGAWVTESYT